MNNINPYACVYGKRYIDEEQKTYIISKKYEITDLVINSELTLHYW